MTKHFKSENEISFKFFSNSMVSNSSKYLITKKRKCLSVVKIVIVLNSLKLVWLARWRFSIDTINNSRPFTDFSHDFGIKISVDFLEEIVQSWFIKQQLTFPRLHPAPGLWWHWTYRREPRGLGLLSQRQHMWNQELIKQNSFCKT